MSLEANRRAMAEIGRPALPIVWDVQPLLLATSDLLQARFGALAVRGEIAGFNRAASGHCYFALKDLAGAGALLRCAMFRRAAGLAGFELRDGQQVELRGRLTLYEARGELQMVVESAQRLGAGALYEEFLRLKARLEAEGLFEPARRRPLPRWPRTLGIVTSTAAAALHDVLAALARRAPQVRVIVYPSPVQGREAAPALAAALALAGRRREVDALLLVRGGGSLEDLWAFNDERVVRAVAASPIPVVCGIGHETDLTLADLAADLRAATPTAAAELAAPSRDEALARLDAAERLLGQRLRRLLEMQTQRLDALGLRLGAPARALQGQRQRLDALQHRLRQALQVGVARAAREPGLLAPRLQRALHQQLALRGQRLRALGERLGALDPQRVLARGFVWIADGRGAPVQRAAAVHAGDRLQARWADGRAQIEVLEVRHDPMPP
jgi:exodeoxyribonuclease VII large subunit